MTILKRLGYYLIGLSLGGMLVAFFFKEKKTEFCYMPNCRVLKKLRSKPLIINEPLKGNQEKDSLLIANVKDALVQGNVNFSKSKTHKSPCNTYVIEYNAYDIVLKNCDSIVILEHYEKSL